MFIAKNNDLIVSAKNTLEELKADLVFKAYTSIEETDIEYKLYNYSYLTVEEIAQKERERLDMLSMTKREMFLGLYQAKQITPDMLKAQITEPTALIEFEYANDYYRGNPLIDLIGTQLGFTTEMLDKFFETKDYHELLPVEEEVENNGAEQASDSLDEDVESDTNIDKDVVKSSNSSAILDEVTDENTTDTDE